MFTVVRARGERERSCTALAAQQSHPLLCGPDTRSLHWAVHPGGARAKLLHEPRAALPGAVSGGLQLLRQSVCCLHPSWAVRAADPHKLAGTPFAASLPSHSQFKKKTCPRWTRSLAHVGWDGRHTMLKGVLAGRRCAHSDRRGHNSTCIPQAVTTQEIACLHVRVRPLLARAQVRRPSEELATSVHAG